MKKRLLALTIAITLFIALTAGCSGGGASQTQAPSPSASEAVSPAQESTEPAAEPSPAESAAATQAPDAAQQEEAHEEAVKSVDISSIELKLPLTEETETLSVFTKAVKLRAPLDDVGISAFSDFQWVKKLEEMTNVHMEWQEISFQTYTEQFNLFMASGDYGDLINGCTGMYSGGGSKALEDDVIIDLSPYLEEYAPFYSYYMNNVGDFKYDFALDDGSVVDFKSFYDEYHCNNGLVIRQDWLDELGLEVPKTYDQMTEALAAIKNEYGCTSTFYMHNGLSMEGLVGGFGVGAASSTAAGSTGSSMFQVDGTVKFSVLEEGFQDYLALLQDWYKKGLINSDCLSIEYDPFSSTITDGVGSDDIAVWPSMYEEVDKYAGYSEDSDFAVTPVSNLVKAEGETDHISTRKLIDNDTMSVSSACENPELAVAWMDFWYSPQGFNMYNYGVEGETYELVDGKPQFTELVTNNEFGLTVAAYMRMWCPYGSLTGIYSPGRVSEYLTDLQYKCWDVWTASSDGLYCIPTGISFTALESEERSALQTDIDTCIDENLGLFVTGAKPMDEWDAFIGQLKTLNVDRLIEIYQDALDRYYAR